MVRSIAHFSLLLIMSSACSLIVDKIENKDAPQEVFDGDGDGDGDGSLGGKDAMPLALDAAGVAMCDPSDPSDPSICVITCPGVNCPAVGTILCPANRPCRVECTDQDSCANLNIDCLDATDCEILCTGQGACANSNIQCAGGLCDIICSGNLACASAQINCAAGICAFNCSGMDACGGNVCCGGAMCLSGMCNVGQEEDKACVCATGG